MTDIAKKSNVFEKNDVDKWVFGDMLAPTNVVGLFGYLMN